MRDEREPRVEQKDVVEKGFENLLTELKSGKSENLITYLSFMSRFHNYSAGNQMLIYLQKPESTLVAGYTRWLKEGNPVRKGEKGIMIQAPLVKKDELTGDGKIFGFRTAYVFDISQTTNPNSAPSFWKPLYGDATAQYIRVKESVLAMGIEVLEEQKLRSGVRGESHGGKITLAAGLDTQSATMILVHEWAHEMIHRREMSPQERLATPREQRECQAEAVSYIVSGALGLHNPFSADYLFMWGNNAEELTKNMDVVQRTSKAMIAKLTVEEAESNG